MASTNIQIFALRDQPTFAVDTDIVKADRVVIRQLRVGSGSGSAWWSSDQQVLPDGLP